MQSIRIALLFLYFTLASAPTRGQATCFDQLLESQLSSLGTSLVGQIVSDGNRLVLTVQTDPHLGGAASGSVLVFERIGGSWVNVDRLFPAGIAPGMRFGYSVALDGDTIAVGALGPVMGGSSLGAVFMFEFIGGQWVETQELQPADLEFDTLFGRTIALHADTLVVGRRLDDTALTGSGSVAIFERSLGSWTEAGALTATPHLPFGGFGTTVAISDQLLLVHARRYSTAGPLDPSGVFVYARTPGGFQLERIIDSGEFGDLPQSRVAFSIDGDRIAIGNDSYQGSDGRVDLFQRNGGAWTHESTLEGVFSSHSFGYSVALSGDRLLVGSPGSQQAASGLGRAYRFERVDGTWVDNGFASFAVSDWNDRLGGSVAWVGPNEFAASTRLNGSLWRTGIWTFPGRRRVYGAALQGANGLPRLAGSGCLAPGFPQSLSIEFGPDDGLGLLLVGLSTASIPLFGGTLAVGPPLFTQALHSLQSDGTATLDFTLDTSTAGLTFFCQALYLDSGAPSGVSMTNGLTLELQ